MAKTVDEEAIAKATSMDLSKPPVKEIGYLEYPRMVYKHPKDKTQEHRTHIVNSKAEFEAAMDQGYLKSPHIPEAPADEDDVETVEVEKKPKGKKGAKPADDPAV